MSASVVLGRAVGRSISSSSAGPRARVLVHPPRRQLGGVALELGADLGDVDDVRGVDVRHERAAARLHGDEVLERQALYRLAQRRAPDAELGHQRVLPQDRSRRQAQGDDAVAEI